MTVETLLWRLGEEGPADLPGRRPFGTIDPAPAALESGLAVWDSWPAITSDGGVWCGADGHERWFALTAPRRADPDARHSEARIGLFALDEQSLIHLGNVFPDGFTAGSREWSGSAAIEGDDIVLRFTAAGHRGEGQTSAAQRLFESRAPVAQHGLSGWSAPVEMFKADGEIYRRVDGGPLLPGKVKGFRDPDVFTDDDGSSWLLFTGSAADCDADEDGVVGLAKLVDGVWTACPPIIGACGFNRELERPHIRRFDGRLYLFWSTPRGAFTGPDGRWPTGLYGAVSDRVEGPWSLVNGDGLVAANPPQAPDQAYGWLVLPDGRVTGFVNRLTQNLRFCGGWAPVERLRVDGNRATLA